MFKKHPEPKVSANIKSSERRKLLTTICDSYDVPKPLLSKEIELKLLPNVIKQASFKNANYQGTIYYNENETPLWFKSRDSGLFPSVFTCWEAGYLLPIVETNSFVIEHLKGYANLMIPGCGTPFDDRIAKGVVVGVVDYKIPTVIQAIGIAQMDLNEISDTTGMKGVAVEIVHVVGDELFKLNQLVDIDEPKAVDVEEPWEEPNEPKEPDEFDEGEEREAIENQEGEDEIEEPEESEAEYSEEPEQPQDHKNNLNELAEQVSSLTLDEIDNFFTRSLLQSIKTDNIKVPITSSNFMSNHVLKNLPVIDSKYKNIKKTSWKKTGKFLKAMAKNGYIQVKGKDDDLTIISLISTENDIIKEFTTHKVPKPKIAKSKEDDPDGLRVIQLYQPTNKYRMFFNNLDKDFTRAYTMTELKQFVTDYIKKNKMSDPKNPKNIVVDSNLGDTISVRAGTSIARNEIMTKFLKLLTLKYVILKPDEPMFGAKIYNGTIPKVEVIEETKIGRKTVTRVKNFERFYIKPHIIEEQLRNLCQGSSTLEKTVEKSCDVIVQGPHHKVIVEYLIEKGIPKSCINFEDKTRKKKR